jgi:hypothetical protein
MADKIFPQSGLPIRKTVELLPTVFRTDTNSKFMAAVVDPLSQPGVLQKTVGYVGRRYGKTYLGKDIYLDSDNTLRSRYQLEPSVVVKDANGKIEHFYDYIDFKNQLKFFGNSIERDDLITEQEHHSWNPPKQCDKFVNYREYYWVPEGPPSVVITGQKATVVSEYSVRLGLNSFIFTPDGYANNPTLVLYRGQTYKFKINAPREGFSIRTTYDTGSLIYNTKKSYVKGQLAIYDGKLWEAITAVNFLTEFNEQDWKYIEDVSSPTAFDYNNGITNNNIENGILTFTVPYNAPDTLYYQGLISPDRFGRFIVADIESNTKIDVEKEIIGKSEYTSSNGVKFTSGLVVEFQGDVTPTKYATGIWVVESVGVAISLTNFQDLVVPELSSNETPEVLFDNEGFDTQPFDDATAYPAVQDYVVIARDSIDRNPWSRYNRWFHREVLEFAYNSRGQEFSAPETARAKRPIIEFLPNLQLFNHGSITKDTVDYIDDYTDDIFSKIEGSTGYNVDGDALFNGARILVVADTDRLANNKIYEVQFITHNNRQQIHLEPTLDSVSNLGDGVLIRRGAVNQGKMFHFNGTSWVPSQLKTRVNQPPRFDVFDEDGVSFGDSDRYPVSSFTGCNILSYRIGNGKPDPQMGFPLSYLNIDNIGDVQYNFEWDTDTFTYIEQAEAVSKKISTGYYKFNPDDIYGNCWTQTTLTFIQPIIDSVVVTEETDRIRFTTINWADVADSLDLVIKVYRNGLPFAGQWTRTDDIFVFDTVFAINDTVSIKVIADTEPNTGYYQLPVGLEKNPLNDPLEGWTLGQAVDHLVAALEFNSSFTGILPGLTNLRDIPINEFGQPYNTLGTRYLRHAGLAPMSIMLLCDKTTNVIKSLQYAKKSYTNFKNNFLEKAITIEYNDNIPNFVDDIINNLTKTKTTDNPFVDSDMIGSGAYTSINYVVEDVGIKTFSLSEKFSLTELSRRAVYVYIDNNQLLNGSDYEFNETFGFVKIKVDLAEGDEIEIREYISTATNYIPPTPSSMGLYKKYTPMKFVDDTYRIPKEVIQGHDGSITLAYGDFRDDLLLELEKRIYNNIKQEYDSAVFDIDTAVSGYYGNGTYTKAQLDSIANKEFLKWAQGTTVNYTVNEYFVENESFTYTYSNMTDPTDTQNLPGYWRGVYQWFYDTDRPHRCPWEMLGFSEQPIWWEAEYGPAPYTSNNLILWEDLQNGVIRQGSRAGRYARYSRPSLLDHIPVDGDGVLLSPLDSGLANNFTLINNKGPFVLGDVGPVEYAWRSSSEWPFTVVLAMCLLKPFEFITDSFDRSRTKINILGQTVSAETDNFIRLEDIVIPETGGAMAVGLVKYLVDHAKSKGTPSEILQNKIRNLDVQLATRLSGFVDKTQQRYLLDSKSPASASSGIFVPPEDYEIIFNISSPITTLTYGGVVLEKTEGGWMVTGYDDIDPYFSYLEAIPTQNDPVISVGGVSENFSDWLPETTYSNGQIVRYQSKFYRAIRTHNSGTSFDFSAWKQLAKVPLVGAVEAFKRKTFNTLFEKKLSYGTKLTTTQQVVDFLLGYEAFLISRGFVFDGYDSETQTSRDWTTSCKEFMFWTKHNWAIGSLITLSPSAEKIKIQIPVGVATDLLDGFYDYQVLKADGKPILPQFINVNRSYQSIDVETSNTTDGLFFLKLFYVLKENVTVFNDRTVFNDILYDKPTGYRQERIKSQGFRTVDWDGDYTSPGFLFDNVNIEVWQPFTDYKLGDIVSYRSYNWTSLTNQLGTEEFEPSNWTRLDSTPEKRLVANFDYRINQMEDYYDVASSGIGQTETALARHAVGYQTRNYLQNLAEDPVTQFQLYQGFIREKGTNNAITKVFDKLSRSGDSSIILNEEWAVRVGQFGGLAQLTEFEMMLYKDKFTINPQPILLTRSVEADQYDQNYRIAESDFTIKPTPFDLGINPAIIQTIPTRTAGYVNTDQVVTAVSTRDDILDFNIFAIRENDHIWITFDSYTWTVLRYNVSPVLRIINVEKTGSTVVIEFQRIHSIAVGDIVGIKNVKNLTGFFKVSAVGRQTIDVIVDESSDDPQLETRLVNTVGLFTNARISSYNDLDVRDVALLSTGSKLWIDNNGNSRWEVIEKQKQYDVKTLTQAGVPTPQGLGKKVIYSERLLQTITSMPNLATVLSYVESEDGLQLRQIVTPPLGFIDNVTGSFGTALALSPDSRFLIVGSPLATDIRSQYQGDFDPAVDYLADDIVLYDGRLWKATNDVPAVPGSDLDDSTWIDVYNENWTPATLIPAIQQGRSSGLNQQGMVTVYEYRRQQWERRESFISPRPADNEFFGTNIVIGQSGTQYYMAVSATGSLGDRGRVYLYVYNGTEWKHLENTNYTTFYQGVYNPNGVRYPAGSVVWYDGKLYQAQTDTISAGDLIPNGVWKEVDPISTQNSLPQNIALIDDGSTLAQGLLSSTQLAELVKQGDKFGTTLSMNQDGSILIVGAPTSDGQYFANYKGVWQEYNEYQEGDVVKYTTESNGIYLYYKLVDPNSFMPSYSPSTIYTNKGDIPENGDPWVVVSSFSQPLTGKVYVYQRTENDIYELKQAIAADSLEDISEINDGKINTGDQFGFSIDLDLDGRTMVVSSPMADSKLKDQGSVYVFRTDDLDSVKYKLKQKLESYEMYPNELFGYSISISSSGEKIVVGAKNSQYTILTTFSDGTIFDDNRTRFYEDRGFAGAGYVFEKKSGTYFLTEKLEAELSPFEAFGSSVDCTDRVIVVGSPFYIKPEVINGELTYFGPQTGIVRLFKKSFDVRSWNILESQEPTVDLTKIKSIAVYDNVRNIKLQDIDYVDHAKLKILNSAEQEIKFKTLYDPAVYTIGTEEQVVDSTQNWTEKYVGQIWWDLSTAKWLDYEQDDLAYRVGNWNRLAPGASIDVYEWVGTPLLPNEWAALADTTEGTAEGISGQPLYPNNDVFSVKVLFNPTTGVSTGTIYYYWVKNKRTIPTNMPARRISAASVATLIENPGRSGVAFLALIDADKFLAYNFDSLLISDTALLNIQYRKNDKELNPVHNEYQLLTDGVADSLPTKQLETKWIDSLVGQDEAGNIVPDIQLSAKQKYGVGFRPRQTMFVDRLLIVRTVIENINTVLRKQAFADIVDYKNLDLVDTAPAEVLNLYDLTVDSDRELETVGTVRVKQAVLRANIINGEIDTIDVIESGFGYRPKELYDPRNSTEYKGPPVVITGSGVDAKAESIIDNQGRIVRVVITARGKRYLTADATVRNFSVLVNADSTINNFWSIYAWDDVRKLFFKTKSQSYDTPRYWKFVDWWAEGFGATSRIVKELGFIADVTPISVQVGDLIRVKEFANGGWAVFEAIDIEQPLFTDNYRMVGRQNGTIEISRAFYENPIAYDSNKTFDTVAYDIENSRELRNILRAAKEDIFVGEYAVEWNKLFFTCIRYVFSEQIYVDWAFKTSFLNAIHNVGAFEQKLNYRNDNLVDFQSYIDEVKPYRTTVREYVSRYDTLENSRTAISDFDLPATYSVTEGKVIPIDIASSNLGIYPWKWWADNNTYSVVSIEIYNSGEGYINPPRVIIEGDGTGATAQAYISSGRVSGVRILTEGTGYTKAPTVSLVGGNGSNPNIAKASAIIGNSNVRTINMTLKFDRVAKTRNYQTYTNREIFTAAGFISVFDLKFAPIEDKSKITVYKNDQLVTQSEFNIRLYRTTEPGYSLLRGQLRFVQPPLSGDIIEVTYEKNDELLSSIDRIEKYYSPTSGMKGKELNQLMTGIDFGGVMIQGTTFDVTGGWDALPWFTDNWDSVESSADFYYRFDAPQYEEEKLYRVNDRVSYEGRVYVAQIGSVGILPDTSSETWTIETPNEIILPFTPAVGQSITIYLKLAGDNQPTIRIDDPFFDLVDDSTITVNPNVKMPTFIGDGSTTVVEIGQYISINAGDTLIFRPIDSDGSVTIKDPNLLDTQLSGGTLISDINGAYSTASGIAADDISLDGDKFISPEQVPAPEENIPGQVLDSVAIRVYNSTVEGAVPLQSRTLIADGTTRVYDIGLEVLETNSILVYVDKIKKEIDSEYTVNFINNTVDFITPLLANSVLEIIAIGIAGISLIDYQEFVADGSTGLFLTNANFADTANVFVTVNGQYQEIGFINSTDIIDTPNKALVQFGIRPPARAVVKIVSIGKNSKINIEQLPVVRVNKQRFEYDGSTRSFELTDYVDLGRGSLLSSMIVEVDEVILKGVDTIYARYDGIKNDFVLGIDPAEGAGSITTNNIRVFVNEELKTFIRDYTYNAIDKVLVINRTVLSVGDIVKIENSLRTEYSVEGNVLTINDEMLSDNGNIEVTWFSQYPSMALVSDEYTGGKVRYILSQKPLGASYVWVYKTTQDTLGNISTTRLTKDIDYSVSLPRGALYLRQETTANDTIKVVMFGSSIYRLPSAFEIHKDMLNVYRFNRYKLDKDVKLSKDLNYYDDVVLVTNANNLFDPVKEKNAPGTVHINGERIDYMIRSPSYNQSKVYKPGDYATHNGKIWRATASVDNTLTDTVDLLAAGWVVVKTVPAEATHVLTELRRGVHGSAIAEIHKSGSYVVDVSLAENLPYTETQNRFDFVSNGTPDDSTAGTAQTMGPLEFIPLKSLKNNWYRETIPEDFGPCDTVEVFVGGRRLRKDPILVYDETEGSSSPLADKMLEAEFSVDGTTNTIRLTTPAPLGTRVTVIRKVGTVWNNAATGSSRVSLLDSGTIIADFIAKQTTELPE